MRLHKALKGHIDNLENIDKNGVYMIYHISKPHLVYIGSTYRTISKQCKKGIYGRWIEHFSRLKSKNHHSIKLQNLINKYGIEGLRFKVIFHCDECDLLEIREREQYYINEYDSFNKGLNCTPDVSGAYISDLNRRINSKRMKINNPMYNESLKNKSIKTRKENYERPILLFTSKGQLVQEFRNILDAALYLDRDSSNVYRACVGEYKMSNNHIVIYKDKYTIQELNNKIEKINKKRIVPKETVERRTLKLIKKVRVYNNSYSKEFESIRLACEELNLDRGAISRCCNGKQKSVKGYYCEFL